MLALKESGFDTRFVVQKKDSDEAEVGTHNLFGDYLKKVFSKGASLQKIADGQNRDAISDIELLLWMQ